MAKDNPFCGGIFAFGIGLILTYSGVQRFLLVQKIKNTPTSKVRSAAVGLTEFAGKAVCAEAMESPISKVKCPFWRVTGEYYYRSRKSSGWRQFFMKESGNRFYLEDDSGKMLIDPKNAEIDIPHDLQSVGHTTDKGLLGLLPQKKLDERVMAYVNGEGRGAFSGHMAQQLRVTEYFISEGDPLYALGNTMPLEGASSAIAHENLIMRKHGDMPMYISDSGEKKVTDKLGGSIWWQLGLGLLLSGVGVLGMVAGLGG